MTFPDGSRHNAEVASMDPYRDLAILRVVEVADAASRCKVLPVTASEKAVSTGESVRVLSAQKGQPELIAPVRGYEKRENTLSSPKIFTVEDLSRPMLVVDAKADNRQQGGPVLDGNGTVIGVVSSNFDSKENKVLANPGHFLSAQMQELQRLDPMDLFKSKRDSIVAVTAYKTSPGHRKTITGYGTGFFAYTEGKTCEAITNHHVVDKNKTASIKTRDGKTFDAKVVLDDPENDLAILRIKGVAKPSERCPIIPLADENEQVKPGDPLTLLSARDELFWYRFGRATAYRAMKEDVPNMEKFPGSNPNRMNITSNVPSLSGDSGSAVLAKSGKAVGINYAGPEKGMGQADHVPSYYAKRDLRKLHPLSATNWIPPLEIRKPGNGP